MHGPVGLQTMSSALPDAVHYHRWILKQIEPWMRGAALEVGSGYGQYTRHLARHVKTLLAVDCDAECVARLQEMPPNVSATVADLMDPNFAHQTGKAAYDVAVCLNVLEHLEDDVSVLHRLGQALKPGGRLVLLVPAHPGLYGPMDALAGHFRRYTRRSMRRCLRAAGFQTLLLRYFNPLGGVGWWLNAKLVRPRHLSDPRVNWQILWYDRYVQPLSRLLDPLTRRFFGQSLWAIAQRP